LLLISSLGAVGETGRGRAKEAVCQANLHQWGDIFGGIVEDNGGKFLTGVTSSGYWWPMQLSHDLQDWKTNRLWLCPTATVSLMNEKGVTSPLSSTFTAWGIYFATEMSYKGETYSPPDSGFAGSYGLNGYVIPIPERLGHRTNTYERGVPATEGWGNLPDVPDASRVPLFLDALRFDVWPKDTDQPSLIESFGWGSNHMANCAINRHDGAVSCLFVDGSVRKVGLKELWTLQWHRSFNTAGPWTKAGGVQPENWPEWIRPLKEY
jgi:prepilin-type processing-associated H-X9-DG protein